MNAHPCCVCDNQSSELFSLTYGAIVVQMLKDYEDVDAVNVELDKMYAVLCFFCQCTRVENVSMCVFPAQESTLYSM
jgi:hypothetical protein